MWKRVLFSKERYVKRERLQKCTTYRCSSTHTGVGQHTRRSHQAPQNTQQQHRDRVTPRSPPSRALPAGPLGPRLFGAGAGRAPSRQASGPGHVGASKQKEKKHKNNKRGGGGRREESTGTKARGRSEERAAQRAPGQAPGAAPQVPGSAPPPRPARERRQGPARPRGRGASRDPRGEPRGRGSPGVGGE